MYVHLFIKVTILRYHLMLIYLSTIINICTANLTDYPRLPPSNCANKTQINLEKDIRIELPYMYKSKRVLIVAGLASSSDN